MKRCLWSIFKFIYGTDNRVAGWLIAIGKMAFGLQLLISLALLSAGDVSPKCTDGRFAPPCTESLFNQVIVPMMEELILAPGFLWLTLGIVGLAAGRRGAPGSITDKATPGTSENSRISSLITVIYGKNYKVAVWFMVMGTVWFTVIALDVAPTFFKRGVPPGHVVIAPRGWSHPAVENIFYDALLPMVSYVMQIPGSWLTIVGAIGALAIGSRSLLGCR